MEKDFYYYKNKEDKLHKGMHNLSGVFLQEENHIKIEDKMLFSFAIIYTKKLRIYYCDNEQEYLVWMRFLRKVTLYSNLSDIYDVKVMD